MVGRVALTLPGHDGLQGVRWPVSRVLSPQVSLRWMAIPLGCVSPHTSRDLPGRLSGNGLRAAPIWSCSRWGLPSRSCCQERGALLPHHFNLAVLLRTRLRRIWRCHFCGAIPGVAPAGRYPAPCLRGARTFLPATNLTRILRNLCTARFRIVAGQPSSHLTHA